MKTYLKVVALLVTVLVLLLFAQTASADTIYLRYFESAYTLLEDSNVQFFSFAPNTDDLVTVVVYGIHPDEGVVPALVILDPQNSTVAQDVNLDANGVAYVRFRANSNGLHFIAVTRVSPTPGAVRIMLFKDDPLDYDITLLDSAAPVLLDRAFLVAGDSLNPIPLKTDIIQANPDIPKQYFAARGDETQTAPLSERLTPVEGAAWQNDNGEIFYALNISANPEPNTPLPHGQVLRALQQSPIDGFFDFTVQIGAGSAEPVRVNRNLCVQTVTRRGVITRVAPDEAAFGIGQVDADSLIEITAVDATEQWVQIVDPSRPIGHSWIPRESSFDLDTPSCQNVQPVDLSWEVIEADYLETIEKLRQQQLTFDCTDVDSFSLAYEALQGNFGNLLPTIDIVLGTVEQICAADNTVTVTIPEGGEGESPTATLLLPSTTPDDPLVTICGTVPVDMFGVTGQPNYFSNDFTGTDECEVVYGNNNGNVISTLGADDVIVAYGGDDTLDGGAGNDAINGGTGNDSATGGSGNDVLDGGIGDDTLQGDAGNDILIGGAGNDSLDGGGDNDLLNGGGGNDTLDGGGGNDTLILTGNMGNSSFTGGGGNNLFRIESGAAGNVTITANGTDTLNFGAFGSGITFDMGNVGVAQAVGGALIITLTNPVQNVVGSAQADVIYGSAGDDSIRAINGDDSIYGGGGSDTINGGAGNDSVFGGWDNDKQDRDDTGTDFIDGGDDSDAIHGGNHNYNGSTGHDGNDSITDNGTTNDTIFGGNLNAFSGAGGVGDDGNDTIIDAAGNGDNLWGGSGNTFTTNDGDDIIVDLNGDNDRIHGGNANAGGVAVDGNDTLTDAGGNNDALYGGNANNGGTGPDGDDVLTDQGGGGDSLYGGNENSGGATGNDNTGGGGDVIDADDGAGDAVISGGNNNSGGASGTDGATDTCITDASDPAAVACP